MARRVTLRYLLTKLAGATEEFFAELSHQPGSSGSRAAVAAAASAGAAPAPRPAPSNGAPPGSLAAALSRFADAYRAASTTRMLLAGAAMAPALNPGAAAGDPRSLEALVVRLLPRPSPRSVSVGDVVAFRAPAPAPAAATGADAAGAADADADAGASSSSSSSSSVLVRRVAALEQAEMVSDEAGDEPFRVPPGHCWLLADNGAGAAAGASAAARAGDGDGDGDGAAAAPPPRDSRAFGFVPMSSVLGRVVYSVRSAGEHGPVANSPASAAGDAAVAEAEVDVDALARMVRAAREQWDDAAAKKSEAEAAAAAKKEKAAAAARQEGGGEAGAEAGARDGGSSSA